MPITLEAFTEIIGTSIILRRYAGQGGRWVADINGAYIKDGVKLVSWDGSGNNPEAAMRDYAKKIQGKSLVLNAFLPDQRREFNVPKDLT